jgi:hypothetical protein
MGDSSATRPRAREPAAHRLLYHLYMAGIRGAAVVMAGLVCACSFDPSGAGGASDAGSGRADATPEADAPGTEDAGGAVLMRVNLGGPAHRGSDFPGEWAADSGDVCDGSDWTLEVEVHGTEDDPLFVHWHYSFGEIRCALGSDLPPGDYEVTLLFGEVWIGPGCPYDDERIFDVEVEGTIVETGLDTVAVGGCCHPDALEPGAPFARSYTATVTDGTMDVGLLSHAGAQTMLSAVELRRLP